MVLATVKVEDFDRFWNVFSTKGAAKRMQHGSKGAHVFRDPQQLGPRGQRDPPAVSAGSIDRPSPLR